MNEWPKVNGQHLEMQKKKLKQLTNSVFGTTSVKQTKHWDSRNMSFTSCQIITIVSLGSILSQQPMEYHIHINRSSRQHKKEMERITKKCHVGTLVYDQFDQNSKHNNATSDQFDQFYKILNHFERFIPFTSCQMITMSQGSILIQQPMEYQ